MALSSMLSIKCVIVFLYLTIRQFRALPVCSILPWCREKYRTWALSYVFWPESWIFDSRSIRKIEFHTARPTLARTVVCRALYKFVVTGLPIRLKFLLPFQGLGIDFAGLVAENLLCHPFVILRRQCQVWCWKLIHFSRYNDTLSLFHNCATLFSKNF